MNLINKSMDKIRSIDNSIMKFVKSLIKNIMNFKVLDICAQTSFYFILSFFPFLIILIFFFSLLPIDTANMITFVEQNIPSYLKPILFNDFKSYYENVGFSILSISFIISIFSASSITNTFVKLLNEIYGSTLLRSFLKNRAISILLNFLFISLIFVFFISVLLISNLINILITLFNVHIGVLSSIINYFIVPLFIFSIIIIIYKVADPRKNSLKKYFIGAIISTALLFISFYSLNIYFLHFSLFLKYGSIGTFIILLLYFYSVSFSIFFGAIVNKVLFFDIYKEDR